MLVFFWHGSEGGKLVDQANSLRSVINKAAKRKCMHYSISQCARLSWFIFFFTMLYNEGHPLFPLQEKWIPWAVWKSIGKPPSEALAICRRPPLNSIALGKSRYSSLQANFVLCYIEFLSLIICICDFKITEERTSIKTRKCKRGLFRRFGLFWWPGPAQNVFQQGMELEAG